MTQISVTAKEECAIFGGAWRYVINVLFPPLLLTLADFPVSV